MAKFGLSADETIKRVKQSPAGKVKVAIVDTDGILRGKYLHKDKFLAAADKQTGGFGFCNVVFGWDIGDVCYDNSRYTGWHSGYPDALAQIDLGTFREIPWDDGVPFFLGDFRTAEGGPLPICPRQLLKRVVGQLGQGGFSALASFAITPGFSSVMPITSKPLSWYF